MKLINLKRSLVKLFERYWPLFIFVLLVIVFFWKYFFKGLIPLPADFIVGTYYPWLNYNWGIEAGVPVKNPLLSDVVSVIYPLRMLVVDGLRNGELTLWNPHMFAGYPLFANFQIAALSPTMIFYFISDSITAWSFQIIFQPFLALVFTYLLCRELGMGKIASVAGSVIFAFSGFNIIYLEWGAHSMVAAFIPLIILLSLKTYKNRSLTHGAFLSIVLTFQIFSGYPQLVLYTLIAALLFILIYPKRLIKKNLFFVFIFLILGLILSSIQLIPALELFFDSQRGVEAIAELDAFLPYQNLVTFIAPDYFGNPATFNYTGMGTYNLNAGYSGVVSLIIAIIGARHSSDKRLIKVLSIIFLGTLIIALKHPLSFFLLENSFHGGQAASATRILVMANLSIALLAATGLESLNKNIKNAYLYALPVLLILIALIIFSYFKGYSVGLKNLLLPTLMVSLTAINLFIYRVIPKYKNKVTILLVVLIALELFRYGWKFTPMTNRRYVFPETNLTRKLQEDKINRIHFSDVIPMNMWVPYGLSSLGSYDAVFPARTAKYIATGNSNDVSSTMSTRFASIDDSRSPLVDIAGINRILSLSSEYDEYDNDLEYLFKDVNVYVYENKSVLPRFKLFNDWEVVNDDNRQLEMILDNNFDFTNKVVLSDSPVSEMPSDIDSEASINLIRYSPDEVELKLFTVSGGVLFLSDTYYPGWKVFVDDKEKEIIRANYLFRALEVGPGEKQIRFIYDPLSVRIGMWISGSVFVLLVGIIAYDKKNKIRKRAA
jgi:hypothetical protein